MLRKLTAIFAMFGLILGSNAWGDNKQETLSQGTEAETTQARNEEAAVLSSDTLTAANDDATPIGPVLPVHNDKHIRVNPDKPTPRPEPTSPKGSQGASVDLEVLEFVLASKIENREPQGITESFANADDRAYAFARLNAKTQGKVTFVWYRNDSEYTRFTTDIQAAKKWRTYASVKLRPGTWKVQLLNEDNSLLAEKTFTLQ